MRYCCEKGDDEEEVLVEGILGFVARGKASYEEGLFCVIGEKEGMGGSGVSQLASSNLRFFFFFFLFFFIKKFRFCAMIKTNPHHP